MFYFLLLLVGTYLSISNSKISPSQPKIVPSQPPPPIRKVFTLASPSDVDGSSLPPSPSYIVGPRKVRKALIHESPRIALHSRHLYEKAQAEHLRLKECLTNDSTTLTDAEIVILKKQKLRAKDAVARYMRESARRSSRSAPSPFTIELGAGGFGKVLFGHSVENGQGVAIKVGSVGDSSDSLSKEHFMLDHLRTQEGFVKVHFYGKQSILEKGVHVVLVLDLLGPSLERLLLSTHLGVKGFGSETVLFIADQLLQRLESLSLLHIVHGDIQPGNFLMGCQSVHDHRVVHLIDFGLAHMTQQTSDSDPGQNSGTLSEQNSGTVGLGTIRGTLLFASINGMIGKPCTYKDDLESLAYALAYLLHNDLPWSNEQPPDKVLNHDHVDNNATATTVAVTVDNVSIPSSSSTTTRITTMNSNTIDVTASTATTVGTNHSDLLSESDQDTLLIQQVLRVKESCRDRGYLRTEQNTGTDSNDDGLCGADKVISAMYSHAMSVAPHEVPNFRGLRARVSEELAKMGLCTDEDYRTFATQTKRVIDNSASESSSNSNNCQSSISTTTDASLSSSRSLRKVVLDWETEGMSWNADGSLVFNKLDEITNS